MSTTWEELCNNAKSLSRTITKKAEQLTDEAATRLKLSAKRAELEELFAQLGRLTYEHTNAACECERGEEIEQCMARITQMREEIDTLAAKINKD